MDGIGHNDGFDLICEVSTAVGVLGYDAVESCKWIAMFWRNM
jgi:hypothetical protein